MGRIRLLILTVPVILLATASFAVTSASAKTVLCKANESPCSAANTAPSGTYIPGIGEGTHNTFKMLTNIGNMSCGHALLGGVTTAEFGNPLPIQGEGYLHETQCKLEYGETCKEAEISEPPGTLTSTGGGNGTLVLGTPSEPLTVTLWCNGFSNPEKRCVWNSSGASFQITGGGVGTISAKEVPFTRVSGSVGTCGTTGYLTVDLSVWWFGGATYVSVGS